MKQRICLKETSKIGQDCSVATFLGLSLEKFARVLELPLYHLMFDGDKPPAIPKAPKHTNENSLESSRSGALLMKKLVPLLAKMDREDRNLLLFMAEYLRKKAA